MYKNRKENEKLSFFEKFAIEFMLLNLNPRLNSIRRIAFLPSCYYTDGSCKFSEEEFKKRRRRSEEIYLFAR